TILAPPPPPAALLPYTTLFRSFKRRLAQGLPHFQGTLFRAGAPELHRLFIEQAQVVFVKEPVQELGVIQTKELLTAHRHQKLDRSEEHTSELQSRENLVCRLLL